MKLYYFPISMSSMKVLAAFHEKHMSISREVINLDNPHEKAIYQKKYILGHLPLLETDTGEMIPESSMIVEYFEDYGDKLIPEDKALALHVRMMDRMLGIYLETPLTHLILERKKPKELQNHIAVKQYHDDIQRALTWLSGHIKGPWMSGENYSMADCAALGPLYFAQNEIELSEWPKIQVYAMRVIQRQSSRKVLDEVILALSK